MIDHANSRRGFLRAAMPLALVGVSGMLVESEACAAGAEAIGSVPDIAALRALPVPAGPIVVQVAGYRTPGDGGGGAFAWDAHYDPGAANLADNGGTYLLPQGGAPGQPGRWRRLFSGPLNVRWFGAIGDDTGSTPAGAGVDITNAPWNNNWPKSILTPRPLNVAKFANDDSWDYIGIQMALLSTAGSGAAHHGEVYIPSGTYRLTQNLLFMDIIHATLTGAGMYQTTLTKTPDRFRNSTLLRLWDTGGQPTTIRDICFIGPTDAQMQTDHAAVNFALVVQNHTNGVHFLNCWFTCCHIAFWCLGSTDCFLTNCTAEICATVIKMDAGTDLHVSDCNLWQSVPHSEQYVGIESAGMLHCVNSRFVGLEGGCIRCTAGTLQAIGNFFFNLKQAGPLIDAGAASQSVITGNRMIGATSGAMIEVGQDSIVTGNFMEQQGDHACINLTHGKTNININGNLLCCTPATTRIAEGGLITSVLPGINFSGGCSQCLITSNTLNQPNSIAVDAQHNMISNNLMGGKA